MLKKELPLIRSPRPQTRPWIRPGRRASLVTQGWARTFQEVMLGRASQEVMPGRTSGEVRKTSSEGMSAAARKNKTLDAVRRKAFAVANAAFCRRPSQVNRQRSFVPRREHQNQIPKQVRDDSKWLFRKPLRHYESTSLRNPMT